MKNQLFNNNNGFFTVETNDNIATLTFKGDVLLPFSYLVNKTALFSYLDLYSNDDSIRVVIITDKRKRSPVEEYFEFYKLLAESKIDERTLSRMYRAYDQLIVKIVRSNKFFISVGHGNMISQDFYVDLACDYKIVADNAVIHKPYLELGLVPKGGGAYFL
ncbi:MAG: enoyl-CoA hydratase-related protein, partial [Syntrophobacterales bacterium]